MKETKILFIMIDGLADVSRQEWQGNTHLQQALTPWMDLIARAGITGIQDPVENGYSCGSDTAHMSLLGYDPFSQFKGRGTFETIGAGINIYQGELGFKCNFGYMEPQSRVVQKRRVDREFDKWGIDLVGALNNLQIEVGGDIYTTETTHCTEHRCGLKIIGPMLTAEVTGNDPLKDNRVLQTSRPLNNASCPSQVRTAQVINTLTQEIIRVLACHPINQNRLSHGLLPANILTLRGAGQCLEVEPFGQKFGLNGFMVAPTAIIKGVGRSIGLQVEEVEGATGYYDSNLQNKAIRTADLLNNTAYTFGFLHVKGVDDAGHDKAPETKVAQIEKVDHMIETVLCRLDPSQNDYVVVLTGDHTTPTELGDHTYHPVPVAVASLRSILHLHNKIPLHNHSLTDNVQCFDEISCAQGVLGRFSGRSLMGLLLQTKHRLDQQQ